MRNEIYLFNPENDMALANFTPYYKAPSEIIRMANDLSVLPAWYAPEGSTIKVDSLSRVSLWREQCPASDFPFSVILPQYIRGSGWSVRGCQAGCRRRIRSRPRRLPVRDF